MQQWLGSLWDSAGAIKFGLVGALLRVLVDPPETRVGALRVFLIGSFFSVGGILAAEWIHAAAAPFAAFAAGFLGDVVARKVLDWIRRTDVNDWIDAWRNTRRGPRE
jgi:hypothetical protein